MGSAEGLMPAAAVLTKFTPPVPFAGLTVAGKILLADCWIPPAFGNAEAVHETVLDIGG